MDKTMNPTLAAATLAALRRDNEAAKHRGWRAEIGVDDVDLLLDRVREAEAVVKRVHALADEWQENYPSALAACHREPDEWWQDLRAALTGAQDADERAGASERGQA